MASLTTTSIAGDLTVSGIINVPGGLSTAPTGAVTVFAANSPPTGYLECNGALLSRTAYAALFAIIGASYGAGNGSTTFAIPDLRGEFIRGWDHGRGVDAARAMATLQGDAIRNITGYIANRTNTGGYMQAYYYSGAFVTPSAALGTVGDGGGGYVIDGNSLGGIAPTMQPAANPGSSAVPTFNAAAVVPTAADNRPRNIAMMYCIKY